MSAAATLEDIIQDPAASGPVRVAFATPTDPRISSEEGRDFDSLEDAAASFHAFGHEANLSDPDGAVGVVWMGEDFIESEIVLRFDNNGTVFFEN